MSSSRRINEAPKGFEALGSKIKVEDSEDQLSVGLSSSKGMR